MLMRIGKQAALVTAREETAQSPQRIKYDQHESGTNGLLDIENLPATSHRRQVICV